jgi:hypothetical protein
MPNTHCQMRHDYPAIGDFGRTLRQYRGDVFVGKAMKAVAAYPLLIQRVRQWECLLDLGCSAVKCGIETRYLRQFGIEAQCHLDGSKIMRLMQRRERHQRLEFGQQLSGHARRSRMMQAAMDDTVAERRERPVTELLSGPRQYRWEDLARYGGRLCPEIRRRELLTTGARGDRRRMCTYPFDLPCENPAFALVEAEFDRRRTGIDYPDQRLG